MRRRAFPHETLWALLRKDGTLESLDSSGPTLYVQKKDASRAFFDSTEAGMEIKRVVAVKIVIAE